MSVRVAAISATNRNRLGGILLGRELELQREAGIAAWDVLRMATSEADLVILDADPLADIRAVERVHAVTNNGDVLKPA